MSDNPDRLPGSSPRAPAAPGKPTDPATRLADLLAEELEELTKPFDPPPAPPRKPDEPPAPRPPAEAERPGAEPKLPDAEITLADIEQALAAAATKPKGVPPPDEPPAPAAPAEAVVAPEPAPPTVPAAMPTEPEPAIHPEAAKVVARVRRLMVISMLITVIGVGSVFGVIGYRIWKGQELSAKLLEKPTEPAPPLDVTLTLPRGAKVLNAGVAEDRLIITLEVDGKVQLRTYDLKTLQPAARLGFVTTP